MSVNRDFQAYPANAFRLGLGSIGGTTNSQSIADNFVKGSAGTAVIFKIVAPVTQTLTDLYLYLTAVAGTAGTLRVDIYNDSSGAVGSTNLGTQDITWDGTANRWNHVSFGTPVSMTQNTAYWIIAYNAASTPGTNHFTITYGIGFGPGDGGTATGNILGPIKVGTLTSGTSSSIASGSPVIAVKFADGTVTGGCYGTGRTSYVTSTKERGFKILGLPFDCTLGAVCFNGSTAISGMKVYKGTTAPGGTTYNTTTCPVDGSTNVIYPASEIVLTRNTLYRVVLTFGSTSTGPGFIPVADAARFADVLKTQYALGNVCDTIDNGSGGWTDTSTNLPDMILILNRILAGGNSWSA